MKGTGNGQDGNGGDEGRDDKRKFRNSKYDFEDKDEESDTEDSCELEITPKQLSQVVPGGGVLKIKLSKKKPIKITAEAPGGEPDPAQTKVKTVHDPINREDGQPISNLKPGVMVGAGQPVEKKIPPEGMSQPMLGMSRKERPNIPPKRMGRPNGGYNGASGRNGDSHDHGNSPNENGGPGGNEGPPDRRGGGPPRENGNPDGGDGGSDPDDSGGGDDSSSSTDSTPPRGRGHRKPKYIYVLQGPPGLPGQEGQHGQPGQVGRYGRDGQALPLLRALEETLRAQSTNLATTGLENSFGQFGRTMSEVLKAQQRTNQNLEEQFRRANETQEFQTEAMQDMAQANFQVKFDHMFTSVPIYDGTDPDTFDDWLYQIESLCEMSHRDVRIELMGWASAQVKHIIRSIPLDIEWEVACRELKRCLTEEKSRAHSAFKLAQIKQKPNENLRIFILRYQDLHTAATGKTAAEDTDPTHIIRFLGMMTNSEIARKITQKRIPEGMTLGQAFTRAIELEGVSLTRPPEVMQIQEVEEVDEIGTEQKRSKDVVCWQCGEKGHLQQDCPYKIVDGQDDDVDDPNAYAGKSEQILRITQPITVATRDNIYKHMGSQRTKANLYRADYRKTKATLQEHQRINAAMATTLAAQNTMNPA